MFSATNCSSDPSPAAQVQSDELTPNITEMAWLLKMEQNGNAQNFFIIMWQESLERTNRNAAKKQVEGLQCNFQTRVLLYVQNNYNGTYNALNSHIRKFKSFLVIIQKLKESQSIKYLLLIKLFFVSIKTAFFAICRNSNLVEN